MINLTDIQVEVSRWALYNFPYAKPHQPLLGAAEEIGELCHAHLKDEQGIRGTKEEHKKAKEDAIGDVIIYLAHYCALNNTTLYQCIISAWNEVKDRDWIKYPTTGKSTEPQRPSPH